MSASATIPWLAAGLSALVVALALLWLLPAPSGVSVVLESQAVRRLSVQRVQLPPPPSVDDSSSSSPSAPPRPRLALDLVPPAEMVTPSAAPLALPDRLNVQPDGLSLAALAWRGDPAVTALDAVADLYQAPRLLTSGAFLARYYPSHLRDRGIEGHSRLQLSLDHEGRVQQATVLSSSPSGLFEQAALRAARHLRYQPAQHQGRAVATTHIQTIDWKLP